MAMPVFPGQPAAQEQTGKLDPLQVVVLVDQSGSIGEADLQREKDAAKTIVFSALATGSEVSVAGFASSVTADRTGAVDVVCDRVVLDGGQKRDELAKCIERLRKRSSSEGEYTDHATALRQALGYVRAGGPEKKIVFLLTDGKLDVAGSESWGEPRSAATRSPPPTPARPSTNSTRRARRCGRWASARSTTPRWAGSPAARAAPPLRRTRRAGSCRPPTS
ncbi:vWA domain-containing protein [Actinokineospora soli]|uniref:VWA domain-containing protein n=1 Tax=Actinokineospora soli TaxID=1048753 RepID=A0ABW2TH97_9PSEU